MKKHFNCEVVANAYKTELEKSTKTWQFDKIAPGCLEAIRYHLPLSARTTGSSQRIRDVGVKATAEVDGATAAQLASMANRVPGSSGSSGSAVLDAPVPMATVENLQKDEDEERVKQEAQDALDAKRAAAKTDPTVMKRKWLSGVSNLIESCKMEKTRAENSKKIPGNFASGYANTFDKHLKDLNSTRRKLEAKTDSSELAELTSGANVLVTDVRKSLKAWKALHGTYYRKDAGAGSGEGDA